MVIPVVQNMMFYESLKLTALASSSFCSASDEIPHTSFHVTPDTFDKTKLITTTKKRNTHELS